MVTFKDILDFIVVGAILIVLAYILLRFIPKLRKNSDMPTSHTLSTFENLITLVITISFGMLGYNIYSAYDIRETKQELEVLREEYNQSMDKHKAEYKELLIDIQQKYENSFKSLERLRSLSSVEYLYDTTNSTELLDYQLVSNEVKMRVKEDLEMFSSIFVASAILATTGEGSLQAIRAWEQALATNPTMNVALYGYAMENFKYGVGISKKQGEYTAESLKYFKTAHEVLSKNQMKNVGQSNYYLGVIGYILLNNIEKIENLESSSVNNRAKKYQLAKQGVQALKKVEPDLHKMGAVDYNLYLNYYALAKNTCSNEEHEKYKELANIHFNEIKSLEEHSEAIIWKMPKHECITEQ